MPEPLQNSAIYIIFSEFNCPVTDGEIYKGHHSPQISLTLCHIKGNKRKKLSMNSLEYGKERNDFL